MTIAVSR